MATFATAWRCSKVILPLSFSRRCRTLTTISSSGTALPRQVLRQRAQVQPHPAEDDRVEPAVVDRGVELVLIEVSVREQDAGHARGKLDRCTVDQRGALALALEGAQVAQLGVVLAGARQAPDFVRARGLRFRAIGRSYSELALQPQTPDHVAGSCWQ